jgi:hypothetical protein
MKLCCALLVCAAAVSVAQAQTTVFSNDFTAAVPEQIAPGGATLTGVMGFAGLGAPGNTFGGSFLRSATGNIVTLSLSGLPQHTAIGVNFLFAAIDSLDGSGATSVLGDYFKVTLDGQQLFRQSFANAETTQIQSYVPPADVLLARRVELGFGSGGYYLDSAYNLGADPTFQNIAHSASSATFTFQIEGPGNQSLADESWAMDNLRVTITPVPEPQTYALLVAGLGMLGAVSRRRRRPAL